jgi:3'-phosphoadenosine 5'-phosphosulfate sulfotransferase (PAPS reductase)/FAD synthetase
VKLMTTIDYSDPIAARRRLDSLIASVPRIIDMAIRKMITENRDGKGRTRELAGIVTMFSGGKDSQVLAHLMRKRTDFYGHANTGIGIEDTRDYVRLVAKMWGVPLIERSPRPGRTYESYVLEHGFPGPGRHGHIFNRIKGDCFRQIKDAVIEWPYRQRVLFVAGRRLTESARRERRKIPVWERDRSIAWVSPLRGWTNLDLVAYRLRFPDIPRNHVADEIDMSGECLCGAFAQPGELALLRSYPPASDVVRQIDDLAWRALIAGVPAGKCRWGRRPDSRPCIEGCNL